MFPFNVVVEAQAYSGNGEFYGGKYIVLLLLYFSLLMKCYIYGLSLTVYIVSVVTQASGL